MKKLTSLMLILVLCLSLCGCAKADISSNATDSEALSSESSEEKDYDSLDTLVEYPLTLEDQAGRTVTIPVAPRNVVSGYYISTSLLIALGQEDKLVGIEAKADKRPIYNLSAPDLLSLPNVGSAKEFDLEGCIALQPDLVILPKKLSDAAESMEKLGIPVLLINPESTELLEEATQLLAIALNCREEAQLLTDFTSRELGSLQNALSAYDTPNVYLAGNASVLSTAGSAMYQHNMLTAAGAVNVAEEITDTYWAEISYEQLLAWNPDYIILASDADYTVEDVLNDPNLSKCIAIKHGDVYKLPSKAEAWDSPIPSGVLGSIWIASILHPEVYTEDIRDSIIEDYYETFYHFSYNEIQ